MKLVIFHYHFLPGGVTTVVRHALKGLRLHLSEAAAVRLVGGRADPALGQAAERAGATLEADPQLDYREPPAGGRRRVAAEGAALAGRLLERYGGADTVWWVHNHHLGKNPVFTQALLEALRRESAQRAILQIHDFPECGRYANLRVLRESLSLPPYPLTPNVRYAVLTARDRRVLVQAGVPEPWVFLLPNPVPAGPSPSSPGSDGEPLRLRRRLADAFARDFPAFDPARPLALYPVRTIRRKNVLEACLLAGLAAGGSGGRRGGAAEGGFSLAVTLPGISVAESPYSRRVEALFRSGLCPGLWGIGSHLSKAALSFEALAEAADLVVSTSVQEGFGYLFLNSLRWRRPLLARNLEVLEGARELFDPAATYLYDRLLCPLGPDEGRRLLDAYRARIANLADILSEPDRARLEAEARELTAAGLVDFSYLSLDLQEEVLARLVDPGYAADLRQANPELVSALRLLPSAEVPDRSLELQAAYGLRRYAQELRRLIGSFDEPMPAGPVADPGAVQGRIVARFARLENLRLLYG
ncbi:MAG: hypothetical protein JW820_00185 [Spirochaetales bacterium]|nr:hypothetical protein [Spirochaetales bacterium]